MDPGFIIVPLVFFGIFFIIYMSMKKEKEKAFQIQNYCRSRGYHYFSDNLDRKKRNFWFKVENNFEKIRQISPMKFFRGSMKFSFEFIYDKQPIIISEMYYKHGSGQNKSGHQYRFGLIKTSQNRPNFLLMEENKLLSFTSPDIQFPEYQTFTNTYHITGDDEQNIRKYFTHERIKRFELAGFSGSFETNGEYVLYAEKNQLSIKDSENDEFISKIKQCIELFK
jgi:hypothetical protein